MARQKRTSSGWLALLVRNRAKMPILQFPPLCILTQPESKKQHDKCWSVYSTQLLFWCSRHMSRGTTVNDQHSESAAKHSVGQSPSRGWRQPGGSLGSPSAGMSFPPWGQREGEKSAPSPTQFILKKQLFYLVTAARSKPPSNSPWQPSLSLDRFSEVRSVKDESAHDA